MMHNRKIRVFIVSSEDTWARNIQNMIRIEANYQYFCSSDYEALDIVQEVFVPDIVISVMLQRDELISLLDYFTARNVSTLAMIHDEELYRYLAYAYNYNIEVLAMPFRLEDLTEKLALLLKPIQDDIDWFNGVDKRGYRR